MDNPSQSVVEFLSSLQDARRQLDDLYGVFVRRGNLPHRPFLVLSGSPFHVHHGDQKSQFGGSVVLGLVVTGSDQRQYQLSVEIMWNEIQWEIHTEVWVEPEGEGQDLVRELSSRVTSSFDDCLEQIQDAIKDLGQLVECVPADS